MKTILVTDTHTQLGFHVCKLLLNQGFNVIALPTSAQERGSYDSLKKKPLFVIPWNRTSSISVKNVILKSLQRFQSIDAACVLHAPFLSANFFQEIKFIEIEQTLDAWIKGSLFLLRELMYHFTTQRQGILTLINLFKQTDSNSFLLDDFCKEGILSIGKSLSKEGKSSNIKINTILSRSADEKSYAEFIVKTIIEKCYKSYGKLFYFQWR